MSFRWTHLIIYIIIYIIRLRLPLTAKKKESRSSEGKLCEKKEEILVIRDWGRRDVFWQRSRKGLIAFLMLI